MSADIEKSATEIITLQIFDFSAEIRLDDGKTAEDLAEIYQPFLTNPSAKTTGKPYQITFLTDEDNTWGFPVLFLGGRSFSFAGKNTYRREAFALIHRTLLSRIRSHIMVEGSALAWDGEGLILTGTNPDRISSVVGNLLIAGFKFISEGMVAFGRVDQLIYPFCNPFRTKTETYMGKDIVPVPLRKFILLEDNPPPGQKKVEHIGNRGEDGSRAHTPSLYPESRAVMGLMNRFVGGRNSILLKEEYDGNTTRLFLDLVNMMKHAECYRIDCAPVEKMASQVEGLF